MNVKSSPNFDDRPGDTPIELLVLHYTGMKTGEEAIARLCDPDAKVSAHYVVEENGNVLSLVPEEKRAWHAGISHWRGRDRLNDNSIGVEVVNPGHEFGYRSFPETQMQAVTALCSEIVKRRKIAPRDVVGHSDIAPSRKEDPGELFDWARLAKVGVGLWPQIGPMAPEVLYEIGDRSEGVMKFQKSLAEYGYGINADGFFGTKSEFIIRAFQRHFDPKDLSGCWTNRCEAILAELLARL